MTLTKQDLIKDVSTMLSQNDSADLVESLFELMKSILASGEDLVISGFGKFFHFLVSISNGMEKSPDIGWVEWKIFHLLTMLASQRENEIQCCCQKNSVLNLRSNVTAGDQRPS